MDYLANGMQPRRFVKPCLLLLLQEGSDYGYDLVARLRALGVDDDSAAVYRTLRRLESEGAVTSSWKEPVAGPARRMYQLTPAGAEVLEAWAEALDDSRRLLEGFLTRFRQSRSSRATSRGEATSTEARSAEAASGEAAPRRRLAR
jgi:PadR family transcriptional regulator PadR